MAFKNTLNYVDLKSTVTFTDINGLVQYVNLSAVDVTLDAFSKDLFFIVGHPNALTLSITDSVDVITFSKVLADTSTITEALASSFAKSLADTPAVSETLVHSFVKAVADSYSISETLASSFAKASADTASVSESVAYNFSKAIANSTSISETLASSFAKASADTASVSESFSKVVSFVRTFTESLSLVDTASNDDPLATDWSTGIGNSATLSESSAFALTTPASDSMTMSGNNSIFFS